MLTAVLLRLAQEPSATAEEGRARRLDRPEIEALVDGLDRFNSPCSYLLQGTEIRFRDAASFARTAEGEAFQAAARRGADGSAAARRAQLERAFDQVLASVEGAQPGPTCQTFVSRILFTPELQIESSGPLWDAESSGQVKAPSFELLYENYEGTDHTLRIWAPSPSPVLYDPRRLLQPIQLDPHGLNWWREYEWLESPADAADPRSFMLYLGDEAQHFRLEVERSSGVPLAASFRYDPDQPEAQNLAFFAYGPIAGAGTEVWLRSVLAATYARGSVSLARYELSEIAFDVRPQDVLLDVATGTTLFDERRPERENLGSDVNGWPAEIARLVRAHSMPPKPQDPRAAPLDLAWCVQAVGALLLLGGAALVLRERKRKTVPA